MDTKAQIQELISLGKTEEALQLLESLTSDAVLLQARFNGGKKQYNMGLIDFSEWSRMQANVNYAALEMLNSVKGGGVSSTATQPLAAPPPPKWLQILMLTANPAGTTKLNLDKEYARIAEKLQNNRDAFHLTVKKAVNRTEFKEFTETLKPAILHFSGHSEKGGNSGGLIVQNDDKNDYEMISPSTLHELFDYFKGEFAMQAVVLNACFSEEQAAAIAQHVPYVIGTTTEINDEHAISFSTGFYFKLANSESNFEQAFKSGRMEAIGAGAQKQNFVLYKNAAVLAI